MLEYCLTVAEQALSPREPCTTTEERARKVQSNTTQLWWRNGIPTMVFSHH
jgi:hypothetical protein